MQSYFLLGASLGLPSSLEFVSSITWKGPGDPSATGVSNATADEVASGQIALTTD